MRDIDVSIVIPLFNERENVDALYLQLREVLSRVSLRYEVIFVDDCSKDGTADRLREICQADGRVTIVQFTRHFGQTAALAAGFHQARGQVYVPMDGDLQNDPCDIPRLVAKLDEPPGWDIVSGWRKNRQDSLLFRRLPSVIANLLARRLSWTPEVHDFGCSLKAYRRDVIDDVQLYGEMHRYLPAICKWRGARITEMEVNHRPRTAGKSKYGLKRSVKVLLDLTTMKFLGDYLTKPIYFFGKLAMVSFFISFLSLAVAICQRFGYLNPASRGAINLNRNILMLLAVMTFLMSILFVMMGVISELLVRIYHESQGRRPYKVRQIIRCAGEELDAPNGASQTLSRACEPLGSGDPSSQEGQP